jgi:ParB/RepB/Spo0J family partition protein
VSNSKKPDVKTLLARSGPLNRASTVLTGVSSTRALEGAIRVKLEQLVPNFNQVRQYFDEEALAELSKDIEARGIIEPLIVREVNAEPGTYEIIVGERRYRAAQMAGLEEVPVIVRTMDDREARFTMLAENVQRQDLDPRDEQRFFITLQNEYNLTQSEIGKLINKSQTYVSLIISGEYTTLQKKVVTEPDREKSNKISEKNILRENSQSINDKTSSLKVKPARYNPKVYKRVSSFFDDTLAALEGELEESMVDQIRQDLEDAEAKLAALKEKLAGKLIVAEPDKN